MNRRRLLSLLVFILPLSVIFAAKTLIFDRQTPATASLRIDSFPRTNVALNDKVVGKTPYLSENLAPGEYKIKLVSAGDIPGTFVAWEAKIKLTGGTLTYVNRSLGASDELSGGQILSLEKLPLPDARELALVSTPDGANVAVDGQEEGHASIVLHNLTPADHEIVVSKEGYSDQVIHGKIIESFRLNAIVSLARLSVFPLASVSAQPTASLVATLGATITKPYVVIQNTETGFLRVRSDSSQAATEVARVKPGEKYSLLSEVSGWVKIKLPTLFGWVSDQYVEKVK